MAAQKKPHKVSEKRLYWGGSVAIALLMGLGGVPQAAPSPEDNSFELQLQSFLRQHCDRCHGEQKQKGGFRLDSLSRNFADRVAVASWLEVIEKLNTGEMPPETTDARPTPEESARIVAQLTARITAGEAARRARGELISFHRLTREEYAYTIRELLGVRFDPTDLVEDDRWQGFERVGSALSISAAHVEAYLAAAESILAEAYPDTPPEAFVVRESAVDLLKSSIPASELPAEFSAKRLRLDLWPSQVIHSAPRGGRIEHSGVYRVRLQVSGVRSVDGRPPHLEFQAESLDRLLFESDVEAPEAEPVILEFEAHLPAGQHVFSLGNGLRGPTILARLGRSGRLAFVSLAEGRIPWQLPLMHDDGSLVHPLLILDWIEWEGPITTGEEERRAQYHPESVRNRSDLRACLQRFAERAFRRPLVGDEIERYVELVASESAAGANAADALRTGLSAILCSKDFLYLREGSLDNAEAPLDAWQLAARLAYFLWSTLPDEPLIAAARDGSLLQPPVLGAQAARMLADPRSERFASSFARQWLDLDRVGHFPPDAELYPDYDKHLERSMVGETTAFFREVLVRNLALDQFLISDWTMLNGRLARHYGLPAIDGDSFQRVPLEASFHRSGMLTQASVLSLTSDGTRHRPVHRGVWLSETIFGEFPPGPPANVEPIEANPVDAQKATSRMQLAAHAANPSCSACHERIDPLGFAFENYDAIGRWRTREQVASGLGDDPLVDASGTLVDGRTFVGAVEFQQLLVEDLERFRAAFIEKLATYALRRPMSVDDRESLSRISEKAAARGDGLADLVRVLVTSDLFRGR